MNCHVHGCQEHTEHVCENCGQAVCNEHSQFERVIGAWFCDPIDFHKGPPFKFYCEAPGESTAECITAAFRKGTQMNPHKAGMAPDSAFQRLMAIHTGQGQRPGSIHARDIPGDGVQAHSKGDLYPCVISVIESYADHGEENGTLPLASRLRYRAWRLSLDGHSEDYATREDAEMIARDLLHDPRARATWRGHRDAAL